MTQQQSNSKTDHPYQSSLVSSSFLNQSIGKQIKSVAYSFVGFSERNAILHLFIGVLLLLAASVSLKCAYFEPDLQRLWVPRPTFFEPDQSLDYVRNTFGEPLGAPNLILIQTPKDKQANVNLLEPEALLLHLDVMKVATQVSVELFDIQWKLKDICYSLNAPDIEEYNVLQVIEKLLPCAIATPLDCFWEGAKLLGPDDDLHVPGFGHVRWTNLNPSRLLKQLANQGHSEPLDHSSNSADVSLQSLTQMLQRGGVTTAYQNKPCLDPTDEECPITAPNKNSTKAPDVAQALMHGCSGFATKWMHWPQSLLLGGVRRNRTNKLSHASALQSVLQLMSESDLFEFYRNHFKVLSVDWTMDKARQVLDAWQRQLTEHLRQWKQTTANNNQFDLHQFTPIAMIDSMRRFQSLPIVSASTAITCILLHLIFALSCSDSNSTKSNDQIKTKSIEPCTNEIKTSHSSSWLALPSLFVLLLTFASSFGCSALLGMPFSATTCCLTPFVAFTLISFFLHHLLNTYTEALVEIDSIRKCPSVSQLLSHVMSRCVGIHALISFASLVTLSIAIVIPVPALRQLIIQLLLAICFTFLSLFLLFPALLSLDFIKKVRQQVSSQGNDRSSDTVIVESSLEICKQKLSQVSKSNVILEPEPKVVCSNHFNCPVWFDLLMKHKMVRFAFLLIVLLVSIFCLVGVFQLKNGLELSDVVPRSTEEHQFLRAQQEHLGVFHMHVVTNGRFDYPQNQRLLNQLHDSIAKLPNVVRKADQRPFDFWLHLFRDWLKSLQDTFDREMMSNRLHLDGWHRNASADAILAYKLIVQTGRSDRPIDRRLISKRKRLVDENGMIAARSFYNYLTAWVNSDAITYSASQAAFKPEPKQWTHEPSEEDLRIPKAQPLQYTQMPFLLHQLDTSEQVLQTIQQVKTVCSRFARLGLHSFPIGLPFLFWQQFNCLRYLLLISITFCILFTMMIILSITKQFKAIVLPTLLMTLFNIQLLGIISHLKLQMNAVPAVVVILSNVIFIQSLLYQTCWFISIDGSTSDRVLKLISKTKYTLMHKTISMAIVVGVLSISEFDYIYKYFFCVLASVVLIELELSFIMYPFLLNYYGPTFEPSWAEKPMKIVTPTKATVSTSIEVPTVREASRIRRSLRRPLIAASPSQSNNVSSASNSSSDKPVLTRKPSIRVQSQISLSTINEEPNDYTSSREVIVQPHLVFETTTTSNAFLSPFCGRIATCYTPNSEPNKTPTCETPQTTDGMCTPSTDRETPDSREAGASSSASTYSRCSSSACHSAPSTFAYPPPPSYSAAISNSTTETRDVSFNSDRQQMPNYERPAAPSPPSQPTISNTPEMPNTEHNQQSQSHHSNHHIHHSSQPQHYHMYNPYSNTSGYVPSSACQSTTFACNQLIQQTTVTKVTATAKLTLELPTATTTMIRTNRSNQPPPPPPRRFT